ncbi:MAG: pilus motility taxis protein HmpF [Cyanobacteria bacterium J06641_5]
MLYIAEVKRQTKGFIGGTKVVLQLLACQRNDQSWTAVSGESIPYEEGTQFGDGALVMVNLANRQVQGQPEPAGERIVGMLQSFSRSMEKSRSQEAEIEEWKQSLTYQAQELNRREEELETSREQIDRQEEELERLEQQRQEIEASLAQLEQQRDRSGIGTQTLDEGVPLGAEQTEELQKLVGALATAFAPAAQVSSQLTALQDAIAQRQALVEQQSQQLGAESGGNAGLADLRQQVLQEQSALEQSRRQVAVYQKALEVKKEAAQHLNQQLQTLGDLQDALVRVAISSPLIRLGQPLDPQELKRLSDNDLATRVSTLEQDLNKVRPFVSDQEEELKLQWQGVEELQKHLAEASAGDRDTIAKELEEEQDRYRFLEETLLGQRRTIKVREDTLEQHQYALRCRKGEVTAADGLDTGDRVDLGPILHQFEDRRNATEDDLHKLEAEFERLERDIAQAREVAELRGRQQDSKVRELTQAETAAAPTDLSSAYEQQRALLQELSQQVSTAVSSLQQTGNAQQTISQLEAVVRSLGAVTAN